MDFLRKRQGIITEI